MLSHMSSCTANMASRNYTFLLDVCTSWMYLAALSQEMMTCDMFVTLFQADVMTYSPLIRASRADVATYGPLTWPSIQMI